ncbi:dihydroorotase [Amnibacterium kyonggiense]|uniref:Dihydroorotase n=1 Tax=Amnibacterium kyonggiense TaxID=595671 RepID=A0A4R7FLZ3_9MICO|nr:dihydroorotase [Amnibacterium kyonggiense]TDS77450.1 dihydroorotase [Amnibacterium kyonggiense]
MSAFVIRGAQLADGTRTDVRVDGGVIVELGTIGTADRTVHADGLLLLPGFIDLHTHLRQPGGEGSETVLTGSRAAAAGGYTTVHAMPNTTPTADTPGVVEQVAALGEEAGYVDVRPIGAVSKGREGVELAELVAMARSRARVRIFSDDGSCVADPLLMRRALEYARIVDGVVAQHAEEPRLTAGAQLHDGAVAADLGLKGWPAVAEEAIIARDALLAESTDSRLHVCHVSTAGSVEVVRWAKARGIRITAEVTPHHLWLTDEAARGYDARFKVNPPLRTAEDVDVLRAALADGTIDAVATDHAPHPAEAKRSEWSAAAMGMVGLESAVLVVQAAVVETGLLGWPEVERAMSRRPAEIAGLADAARPIAVGRGADLVLLDPSARRRFDVGDLAGRSTNSPYLGQELPGRVVATFFRGVPTVLDGRVRAPEEIGAAW